MVDGLRNSKPRRAQGGKGLGGEEFRGKEKGLQAKASGHRIV